MVRALEHVEQGNQQQRDDDPQREISKIVHDRPFLGAQQAAGAHRAVISDRKPSSPLPAIKTLRNLTVAAATALLGVDSMLRFSLRPARAALLPRDHEGLRAENRLFVRGPGPIRQPCKVRADVRPALADQRKQAFEPFETGP